MITSFKKDGYVYVQVRSETGGDAITFKNNEGDDIFPLTNQQMYDIWLDREIPQGITDVIWFGSKDWVKVHG